MGDVCTIIMGCNKYSLNRVEPIKDKGYGKNTFGGFLPTPLIFLLHL